MIVLTKHAHEKFAVLLRHGVTITEQQVRKTVEQPEVLDLERLPLFIAQRKLDARHVLRVVYKKEGANQKVITFYPGRTSQYAKKT